MSNKIDKTFEQIFGRTVETLANKLINITNKKNQIIIKNIVKNRDKLYEIDSFNNDWMIQPSDQRIDLIDAIDLILDFNKNQNQNQNQNVKTLMPSDKDDDKMMSQNVIKKIKW